jgi:GT2 family glycosyltransferase
MTTTADALRARAPAIAVIVATHRRPDAIATLLRGLARQTLPKDAYEVAVVVDGRDELEADYRRVLDDARDRLGVPLVAAFQDNAGPASARHRAIRATRAPWLCISDDDMDVEPGYLAAHLEALESGGERTVVIGEVVPEAGWEHQPLYEAARAHSMLALHDGLRRGTRRAQGAALVTQNVSLARSAYDRVGGFDETLRLGEDTELGWRLERDGARFVFGPGTRAVHRSRVGSYEAWLERQFQYGRNAVYIHRKLGRDPRSHPLRNLLNGRRLKRAAVQVSCLADGLGRAAIAVLRRTGDLLQRAGWIAPAVATHKGIAAIAYHLGVKQALGSWTAVRAEGRAFLAAPDHPLDPT